jgi:hypothetical protein
LGYSERFVEQTLDFVQLHHLRLTAALEGAMVTLTLGALEEVKQIAALMYRLSAYYKDWRFVNKKSALHYRNLLIALLTR